MNRKQVDKSFVHQHDSSDCGAACLLAAIRYFGGDSTITHLRSISGTSITGTTLLGLYQAATKMGIKATGAEASAVMDLAQQPNLAILAVVNEQKYEHYVVCYGYCEEKFVIGDPAFGVRLLAPAELGKIWTFKCLLLEPTAKFILQSDIIIRKRQWLRQLVADDIGILTASLVVGIIFSVLGMVMAVFSQKLVDEVLPQHNVQKLVVGLSLVFVLLLVRILIGALRSNLLITQSRNFNNRIINFFYSRLLNLPKAFFDTRKTGDMVARLNDTRRIQNVISSIAGETIINTLMVLVSLSFLFFYSWQVALVAILSVPVFFVIIYRHNSTIVAQQHDAMTGYSLTESNFISTISGIAAIKNFNRQPVFERINQVLYASFQDKVFVLGKTQIRIGLISGLASVIIIVGLIACASALVFSNALTVGQTMAVIGIAGQLFPAVASLALVAIPIGEAKVAFNRMFEVVGEAEQVHEKEDILDLPITIEKVDVCNLSFRFVGRKKLLSDVDVTFERGKITCIVGESGCGKSTLCQLLQRFYFPETGTICANSIDITRFTEEQWCGLISVVPQDVFIYNGTVADNICFGAMPRDVNLVMEFCGRYGFNKLIEDLPQGLFTIVGEEGINLSGGQKQMVALARALYKQSQVLILDEFTSAMDRKTEHEVCEILKRIKHNHIIIFVTHRLETASNVADKICVVQNGRVLVEGTHKELMQTGNFYSEFWM